MTSALLEKYVVGGEFVHGDYFQSKVRTFFSGVIPQPGTAQWPAFIFACQPYPIKGIQFPAFPRALEAADHFLPYELQQPRTPEPFWVGFWSTPEARNPYRFPENGNAWDNGRTLATSKNAATYRAYLKECEAAIRRGA